MRERQGLQEHAVDEREERRGARERDREGRDRDGGDGGRRGEGPPGVPQGDAQRIEHGGLLCYEFSIKC